MPQKAYKVKSSKIHGNGVFAARDIAKGERILEYLGEKISKDESNKRGIKHEEIAKKSGGGAVYIFELNDEFDIDGNFEYNDARFINHACTTNCEAENIDDTIWIVATKDIKKDEEILYNYGYAFEHFMDHPCRCGQPNCVGFIVAEADRIKLKKVLAKKSKRKIIGLAE